MAGRYPSLVNPTMTPSGVEQLLFRGPPPGLGRDVNPTMTPSGVEQDLGFAVHLLDGGVNPTMTPSGVEQSSMAVERRAIPS